MSHTKRIYNRHPITGGPGFQGWISSQKLESADLVLPGSYKWQIMLGPWIGYHPYAVLGRMRGWKDWRLRVRRRQARKMEVRAISREYAPFGRYWGPYE